MYIFVLKTLNYWFDTQLCYRPVTDFSYWPVIGSFNNWNIITLSQKATTSEAFEEIHQVVLDGISDNMASLVQSGKYGSMKTTFTSTMVYYIIKFVSEAYNLQEDTTCDKKISSAGELVVKAHYLKLYAGKYQLVLGAEKSATSNYCSNTNYCAPMY